MYTHSYIHEVHVYMHVYETNIINHVRVQLEIFGEGPQSIQLAPKSTEVQGS